MKWIHLEVMIIAGFFMLGIHSNVYASEKITDNGNTIKISGDISNGQSSLCFIDSNNGGAVDSSDKDEKIIKTANGGASWDVAYKTPANQPLNIQKIFFINQTNGWMIEQTTSNSPIDNKQANDFIILKTVDGGKSFHVVSQLRCARPFPVMVYFSDKETGYVLAALKNSYQAFLFETSDGGNTWVKTKADLSSYKYYQLDSFKMFDTKNGVIAWLSGADGIVILKTDDGGNTWFKSQTIKVDVGHACFTPDASWLFDFHYNYGSLTISKFGNKSPLAKIASIPATRFHGGQLITKNLAIIAIQQGEYPNNINKLLFTDNGGATWISYNLDIYIYK
jgi:hypothetical protein